MASLFKRKNGYWYLSFYSKDQRPRRKQIATGTTINRDAQKIKRKLERGFLHGEYDPWEAEEDTPDVPSLDQLGAAVEAFMASRANLRYETRRRYRTVIGQMRKHLGDDRQVRGITPKDLHSYLDSTDTKPVTKHSYRRAMKTFFNWLIKREAIEKNPADALRLERAPNKHPRFLEPEDVEKICKAIRKRPDKKHVVEGTCQWLIPIVRANVYLGLRAGEVCNVRWENVDLKSRLLHICNTDTFTTKAAKERTLPLCDAVMDILWGLERRCDFVFPNYGGTQLHKQYLSRRFKHFARAANLPEHIHFHTTRHTAASWLAKQGAPVEAIREYMGHSSITVTQKYMHLSPDALFAQINQSFGRI